MNNNSISDFHDPDFDTPEPHPEAPPQTKKSFFDQLTPQSALIVGLVGGVMVLCTIGFIVLLILFLKQ